MLVDQMPLATSVHAILVPFVWSSTFNCVYTHPTHDPFVHVARWRTTVARIQNSGLPLCSNIWWWPQVKRQDGPEYTETLTNFNSWILIKAQTSASLVLSSPFNIMYVLSTLARNFPRVTHLLCKLYQLLSIITDPLCPYPKRRIFHSLRPSL